METDSATPTQDKQVTVDVPDDRVAEFYAFYARFLAGRGPGRRRGGHRGHRHHGCAPHHRHAGEAPERPAAGEPREA